MSEDKNKYVKFEVTIPAEICLLISAFDSTPITEVGDALLGHFNWRYGKEIISELLEKYPDFLVTQTFDNREQEESDVIINGCKKRLGIALSLMSKEQRIKYDFMVSASKRKPQSF